MFSGLCSIRPQKTVVAVRCCTWCYTPPMPTVRPRHAVTETEEIAQVLDEASRRWPDAPRSKLIKLIMLEWIQFGRSPSSRSESRLSLVGSLPGSSALYDRSGDWPA